MAEDMIRIPLRSMFKPLGDLFIQLIKMLVVPLVAVSIISGAAALGETRSAGLVGGISIAYMMLTTLVAIIVALLLAVTFEPGSNVDAAGIAAINEAGQGVATSAAPESAGFWDTVIGMIPENPIAAAEEVGLGYNLVAGANIAGFKKVADAMLAQGTF